MSSLVASPKCEKINLGVCRTIESCVAGNGEKEWRNGDWESLCNSGDVCCVQRGKYKTGNLKKDS